MVKGVLFKKAYRAMWAHKRAYLACVFLIMIGTMLLTAMGTAVDGLKNAKLAFYDEYKLADCWASVGAIPISEVERLRNIEGVADVSHRTMTEVRAAIDGNDEIITLRLFSFVPDDSERINNFRTTGYEPNEQNEIVLSEGFFLAHELNINSKSPSSATTKTRDEIKIFSQGRALNFKTTGSIMSPEYIYIVPGGTEMLPDNIGFGVGYVTEDAMNNLTGRAGLANQILFTLRDGYEFEDVYAHLQDALRPYGLISVSERMSRPSYSFLDMQVSAMESVATSMPFVFVSMAVFILYLMLKRIIEQERTQIGVLKAFGYSNKDLLLHYMAYGAITGFFGGVLGFAYGGALSGIYLQMFLEFFSMPELTQPVKPIYLFASLGIAMGGGLLGSFAGALRALKLTPCEAMRPESPKPIKFDIIGKIKFLKYILTSRGQLASRNIIRNPFRSGFVVIGVTFSYVLLVVYGDMEGMVDTLLYSQFVDMRTYNVRANLIQPLESERAVEAAFAIPHITHAEAIWEVPVTLSNRHIKSGAIITGIPANGNLLRIFDTETRKIFSPPTDGLIITNGLADQLHAREGDILYLSNFLLRDEIPVPVTKIISQNVGSGAYIEIETLAALLEHPVVASAIIFNTDNLPYVSEFLKESQIVGTIDSVDATLQQYIDMMAPYSAMYSIMFFMGVAIAFAIIYNTATISLSERQREFATLRVLGLSVDEVCEIMRFEYWVLAAIGIAIGIPMASALLIAVNTLLDTSMMSMPTTIRTSAYFMAAFGCVFAILLSNFSTKRKIKKFNMVEVLKERE
jgi:putative ABC transport system permease protein